MKSYKLKGNNYIDSSGIVHEKQKLNEILNTGIYNGYIDNLNNALNTGTYAFNSSSLNIPENNMYGNVLVLVGNTNKYDAGESWWVIQIAFTTRNSIFMRNLTNGTTWTSWTQV